MRRLYSILAAAAALFLLTFSAAAEIKVEAEPTARLRAALAAAEAFARQPNAAEALESNIRLFRELRDAFAESPAYDPYGDWPPTAEDLKRITLTYQGGEHAKARAMVDPDLARVPVSLQLRVMAWRIALSANDQEEARFQQAMLIGLVTAMVSTGDGFSPDTAMEVLSPAEEVHFMDMFNMRFVDRATLEHDGRVLDKVDFTQGENSATLYFDVTRPLRHLARGEASGTSEAGR